MEEQLVRGTEIDVKPVLLDVLEQRPPGAVDDALRASRRPRGEEDEERVVEGEALEARLAVRLGVGQRFDRKLEACRPWPVVEGQDAGERRQRPRQLADSLRELGRGCLVREVGHQELRRDLLEAAEKRRYSHLGRRARERGSHRRGRQSADHSFDIVARDRRDAVPGADAKAPELLGGGEHT